MEKSVCEEVNYSYLYTEHMDSVRNMLYYKCGDMEQAEDLAHEAFVRLWKHCAEVAWATAKGFIFTAAHRLFLNSISHQKVVLRFEKENPLKHTTPNPEFVMEEQEFKVRLEDAISALPDRQRQIFLLSRIDKMSYKEIAETMEISVKAVEKSLGKVMKKLREGIDELNQYKI